MAPLHALIIVWISLSAYVLLEVNGIAHHDVIVYGSTPAGIMSAVTAARVGRPNNTTVAILSVTRHVGGMSAGGLGRTDAGPSPESTIGGLAREFFQRNTANYNQSKCCVWNLEPHVAAEIFKTMLSESGVTLYLEIGNVLEVSKGTAFSTIESIVTEKGAFSGNVFIDASYEGDLLAIAGVSHTIGRESRDEYGESFAGNVGHADGHSFILPVDPFLDVEQTELLPLMTGKQVDSVPGQGDGLVQAYNFRLCMSKTKKVDIPKPTNYKPERWELFRRYIIGLVETNMTAKVLKFPSTNTAEIPNEKYDCNNAGAISTDYIGGSWKYPTATYAERDAIWNEHKEYTLELFWFLRTDSVVPIEIRKSAADWGLCADEFSETDHWPPQLYIREARRMLGDSVFTQCDIESEPSLSDFTSIGLGSYNYDAHNAQRVARVYSSNNWPYAWNEGDLEVSPRTFYEIPFYVLFPKRSEVSNMITPVSLSASHVAYNTLRMEPQFMIMGQAAGTIAALTLKHDRARVQDVELKELRRQLLLDGQIVRSQNSVLDH